MSERLHDRVIAILDTGGVEPTAAVERADGRTKNPDRLRRHDRAVPFLPAFCTALARQLARVQS